MTRQLFLTLGLALLLTGTAQAESDALQTASIVTARERAKPPAAQAAPREVVEALYGKLLHVMQKSDDLGFKGRYEALKPIVERSFDLPLMTRFAAGSGWLKADAVQQQKLINAFSDFSIATYASRFSAYDQEQFQIVGEKPATGGGTIVETRLVLADSAPVTLNYLLRQDKQGQWRINDVFLDATISEMATRRAEFGAVIRDSGVDALIGSIDRKAGAMRSL